MNSRLERFNRTIQEEFIDYHSYNLIEPDIFNHRLVTMVQHRKTTLGFSK